MSQIEHFRGREKALEPLGWRGRKAEWIALVCLHSGVFTRSQFCSYRNTNRMRALRLVRRLVEQSAAIELTSPMFSGGARACRITSKRIYRALGVENFRHRRAGTADVTMRRLLSLDYILEHPELAWLPTEPEKVAARPGSANVAAPSLSGGRRAAETLLYAPAPHCRGF